MYNTRSQLAAAALFYQLSSEKDLEENDNTWYELVMLERKYKRDLKATCYPGETAS